MAHSSHHKVLLCTCYLLGTVRLMPGPLQDYCQMHSRQRFVELVSGTAPTENLVAANTGSTQRPSEVPSQRGWSYSFRCHCAITQQSVAINPGTVNVTSLADALNGHLELQCPYNQHADSA